VVRAMFIKSSLNFSWSFELSIADSSSALCATSTARLQPGVGSGKLDKKINRTFYDDLGMYFQSHKSLGFSQ